MISAPFMLLSDPHFHAFKAHSKLVDGVNSRLFDVLSVCNQALDAALRNGVELMLIAGDIFHVRGQIKPSIFNMAADWLHNVLEAGIDVALISGNHDMESFRNGASSVHSLAYIAGNVRKTGRRRNVAVLTDEKPLLRTRSGMKVIGIPYTYDHEKFKASFSELSMRHEPDIALIHQGIDDFDFEGAPSTGLSAGFLLEESGGLIASGHYHKPGRRDRVINVGAPLQHRVSDRGQDRGCWIVSAGGEVRFHALDAPRFVSIDMKDGFDSSEDVEGNFIHIKATSLEAAREGREEALRRGAASVQAYVERIYQANKSETVQIESPRSMLKNFTGMFEKYRSRQDAILRAFDKLRISEREA